MRILHTAALLTPTAGIVNQMAWEQDAAKRLCLNWKVRIFCPVGSASASEIIKFSGNFKKNYGLLKLVNWVILRWDYHKWLMSLEGSIDIFLLRYYVHDPFQLLFIIRCKKPVYLVHHTLEVPELALAGGFVGKLRAVCESLIGRCCINHSNAIIGVTREIISYEKNRVLKPNKASFFYPNGIMFKSQTVGDKRSDIPELLFVASFFESWHGLDLLIEAMRKNNDEFILHLVGSVGPADLAAANKDKRIVLHGQISHKNILEIAATCSLGLSSFALFRKKMTEACTLKVREYLMMGLPVYGGYKETFPEDFRFYLNGSLCIQKILTFSMLHRSCSRLSISDAARPYIDKAILLDELASSLSFNAQPINY